MTEIQLTMDGRTVQRFEYRRCGVCGAALVVPTPPGWFFDLIKEGPEEGPVRAFIQPHQEGCKAQLVVPLPGISLRLTADQASIEAVDLVPSEQGFGNNRTGG